MHKQDTPLDPEFIEQQRQQLETLQAELQASGEFRHDDELQLQSERANQSHASGGDAQHIALQDNNRAVSAHALMQLDAVRRALEKIEDGTYGRSDESGDPIPRARLEALPASLYTVEEEEARERDAQRAE
ncbi:TraR/DksA family transcriptional regulator [Luteimonas terrae]|uniref:DnaK suppressor protein n=1 Tax=Luteimonas terrae TaxID=1530191 RepID=A0ABU1XTE0_9GAMM|nr:TraR/DksA family transcriptional regulator [Luteimonas terrae]MDR7192027.1 DnaK suppressor protein [Luteimonas terrae]